MEKEFLSDLNRSESMTGQTIRVSCPKCLKMYAVDSREVSEARPKFQCKSCESQFWVAFPECLEQPAGVIGFPMDWIKGADSAPLPEPVANIDVEPLQEEILAKVDLGENMPATEFKESPIVPVPQLDDSQYSFDLKQELDPCPKCGFQMKRGSVECKSCGVIPAKFLSKDMGYAPEEAKNSWEVVINNYDSSLRHQDFIALCQKQSVLDYAAQKYQGILEACPNDELAQVMFGRVKALAKAQVESLQKQNHKKSPSGSFLRGLRISTMALALCAVVITVGYLVPGSRNLVGFGTAVMFILLALRFYFRLF